MKTQQTAYPAFRIRTLGPFQLERREMSPEGVEQWVVVEGKALGDRPGVLLSLLKLLLSQPQRFATKATLADTLWPDADEENAGRSLRMAKNELSKVLRTPEGANLLSETPDSLGVSLAGQEQIEVDADRFEAAVQEASHAEQQGPTEAVLAAWKDAYDRYTGVYLLADEGMMWSDPRRLALEHLYALCVQRLALSSQMCGNRIEAERLLRTYWASHLTDEENLVQLMELVASRGRYREALHFYKRSVQALRDELGVGPCEQLKGVAEQIRKQGVNRSVPQIGPLDIVSGSYQLAPNGLLVPPAHLASFWRTLEGADTVTVMGALVIRLLQAVASWHGRAQYCEHLQVLVNEELERWNIMTQPNHEARISRRTALAAIAAMPLAMVPAILGGQRSPLVLEEFLPECTASITACWHLMRGNGLATVAEQLPQFLPALEMLAKQPSRYQKTAAHLAAQGCLLMGLVALHRLDLRARESYNRQAEYYSTISDDQTLHVTVLSDLACSFYYQKKVNNALSVYDKAITIISQSDNQLPSLLQSKVFVLAAASYAQAGQGQTALRYLGKAHESFTNRADAVPIFFDYGIFSLFLCEGQTYRYLGDHAADRGMLNRSHVLYNAGASALEQIRKLDPTITDRERTRIEIINNQATIAMALGEMEMFQNYLKAGAEGAKKLGSEKRKQEAVANWRAARQRWPHEAAIADLADVLV